MGKFLRNLVTVLILAFLSAQQVKAEPLPGEELFIFHMGYFLPAFDTRFGLNSAALGKGDEVSAEDDLGLDANESIFRGDVTWRMSERNRLNVGYFRFARTGSREIDRQIQIGDEEYPVGATLESDFSFTVIPISYYYSFVKTDEWEVGGGAGLQWSSMHLKIIGSASLNNLDGSRDATGDADAPMPLLAMDAKYYIFPTWSVGTNLGAFVYKIGASNMTFQGSVYSVAVNTDYWFSTYVGIGAAVNWFKFNIDVDSAKWDGSFNYQYWGPQAYLSARF